jgi:hypothetical protein
MQLAQSHRHCQIVTSSVQIDLCLLPSPRKHIPDGGIGQTSSFMSLAGHIYLHVLYQPWCKLVDLWNDGGPLQRHHTAIGRQEMTLAANHLLPITEPRDPAAPTLEIQLLTGSRYWFQTAFLLRSLAPFVRLLPIIHDDGTLAGSPERDELQRIIPSIEFADRRETEIRLDDCLPRSRFPALRSRHDDLVLMRKILDVHAGRTGWRLFLDSDMLCLKRPNELLQRNEERIQPFHMTDVANAYGYPLEQLDQLAGRPVPRFVNTGMLGMHSEVIDWPDLERVCAKLNARPHYFQEQALIAHVLSRQTPAALPVADYRVLPNRRETENPQAVLHHFVAHSKRWYYQTTWRRFATRSS